MRGVPTKTGVIRSFSKGFEIIGMIVVLGFLVFAVSYGLTKALDNRCNYYTQVLNPTEEIKRIC